MALRTKTIEVPFESNTTGVAASTTYTSATRTIYIPENASRTFRSVILRVYVRGNETAATSATNNVLGIQLAAAAFNDATVTVTPANTGDQQSLVFTRDCTSYFTTNFGTGTSQTVAYRATFAALPTIQHTAKLIITYEWEDNPSGSPQVTRVKTVRIPLESNLAQLTATLASIGSNQIPNLDTFLPESGKVYRDIWFEICANDAGNATTDFQLGIRLDAETEVLRSVLRQTLNTAVWYEDIWIRNDMTTNATHDFQARSTLASRFSLLTVVLHVTYEYNHSTSTRVINSLVLPCADDPGYPGNTTGADRSRFERVVWVQEPGTITLVQSGIIGFIEDPATVTLNMQVGAQSASRAYALTAGSADSGPRSFAHRIDSGSAVGAFGTLARGRNNIRVDWWSTAVATGTNFCANMLLNYTSDIATGGDGTHNHSTCWRLADTFNSSSTLQRNITATQIVNIPETDWFVTGFSFELHGWRIGAAVSQILLEAEFGAAEGPEAGWVALSNAMVRTDGELGVIRSNGAVRDTFRRWNGDTDTSRLTVGSSRQYRVSSSTAVNTGIWVWFTYHAITYSRTTTVTNAAAGTVTLNLCRATSGERVLSATRSGNGTVAWTWYDNTENMFIEAVDSTGVARRSRNFLFP